MSFGRNQNALGNTILQGGGLSKMALVNGLNNTFSVAGIAAMTTTGTLTTNNQADKSYTKATSGIIAGNSAGIITTTFNIVAADYNPLFEVHLRTDSTILATRIWVGLCDVDPGNSDTPSNMFTGFRYSTVAGDTGWTPIHSNTGSTTTGTTIGTVATDTSYLLRVRTQITSGGSSFFSVNNGAEQKISGNMPTGPLGFVVKIFTTVATAKAINIARAYLNYT